MVLYAWIRRQCAAVGEDIEVAPESGPVTRKCEGREATDPPTAKRTNEKQATKQTFGDETRFQRWTTQRH